MNSIIETLNHWGGQTLHFAWPMLWQSSLLIAVVFALDLALRRKVRAAVRYALWLVVLLKLLLPPSLALPSGLGWWLRGTAPTPARPAPARPQTTSFVVAEGPARAPEIAPELTSVFVSLSSPQLSAAACGLVASSATSLGLLAWMLGRWRAVARDGRRAREAPGWLAALLEEMWPSTGLRHGVRLRLTDQAMSPAVCGLFRPTILLPQPLIKQVSPSQLRTVLLHELIHLRRGDVWVNCAQALLQIVYWWHPLLWLANARIRRLREEAVDDAVMLALREDAASYAPTLLEVAKLALHRPLASLGLVGILESRNALRQRIERLVNYRAPRQAGLTLLSIAGIGSFTALAVPMGEAPMKPNDSQPRPQPDNRAWPDSRFSGYEEIKLRAQFLVVDESNLRSALPSLTDLRSPLVVGPNEVSELQARLKQANAFSFVGDESLQFPPFSGGRFHWRIGGGTNNVVNWQSRSIDDPTVIGANVEFMATHPDWLPLEFAVVPWKQSESIRCQAQLTVGDDTNASQRAEVVIPLGGGLLWAAPTASGRSELVWLREEGNAPDTAPSSTTTLPVPGVSPSARIADQNALARVLVQEGKWLFERGNLDEAEAKLRRAIIEDPQNQAAHYYLNLITEARSKKTSRRSDAGIQQIPLAKSQQRDAALTGAIANTNLIVGSKARQAIFAKLDRIRLDNVVFDNLPLSEVVRHLSDEVKKRDPENRGINFIINTSANRIATNPRGVRTDPTTGLAAAETPAPMPDLSAILVKIRPALTDVRVADVLDAIVEVADQPIKYSVEDYAVVFSRRTGRESRPLYVRTFKLDPNTFAQGLESVLGAGASTNAAAALRQYFTALGMDLSPPKNVFWSDRNGMLIVRASREDLDIIERAIQVLNTAPPGTVEPPPPSRTTTNHTAEELDVEHIEAVQTLDAGSRTAPTAPQVRIKVRLVEVEKNESGALGLDSDVLNFLAQNESGLSQVLSSLPHGPARLSYNGPSINAGVPWTGVLKDSQFRVVLRALEQRDGPKLLLEQEVTTESGRQTRIGTADSLSGVPTGPILDLVPYERADGWTIQLTVMPTVTEFLGCDSPPGQQLPLPHFRLRRLTTSVAVGNGQTCVVGGLTEDANLGDSFFRSEHGQTGEYGLMIFVTPTIVDPAGHPVDSGEAGGSPNPK